MNRGYFRTDWFLLPQYRGKAFRSVVAPRSAAILTRTQGFDVRPPTIGIVASQGHLIVISRNQCGHYFPPTPNAPRTACRISTRSLKHGRDAPFQEQLGRPRRDSLARDRLPGGEFAATLPVAAAIGLRLLYDLRAGERAWTQLDWCEVRWLTLGPKLFGPAGRERARLSSCSLTTWPEPRPPGSRPLPSGWHRYLHQLAIVKQLEDDLA